MRISEVMECEDGARVDGVVVRIVACQREVKGETDAGRKWNMLPITAKDAHGQIKLCLFGHPPGIENELRGRKVEVGGTVRRKEYRGEEEVSIGLDMSNLFYLEGSPSEAPPAPTGANGVDRSTPPSPRRSTRGKDETLPIPLDEVLGVIEYVYPTIASVVTDQEAQGGLISTIVIGFLRGQVAGVPPIAAAEPKQAVQPAPQAQGVRVPAQTGPVAAPRGETLPLPQAAPSFPSSFPNDEDDIPF